MAILYKDINELQIRPQLTGEEKLPVSSTEYITPGQISELSKTVPYNTTAYWNAQIGFIPEAGQIIVYSDYKQVGESEGVPIYAPGFKIGSGNAYIQDLVFADQATSDMLTRHLDDTVRHITAGERAFWNNKLNVNDSSEVQEETLIFNRN